MQQLLVLNIPPEIEDDLVDYLLTIEQTKGFTSYPVRGHGEHRRMSIAEQVTGRRNRIQFELILPPDAVASLIAGLNSKVGTDIFYWYQEVLGSGHC
jgi:hypothetical protein